MPTRGLLWRAAAESTRSSSGQSVAAVTSLSTYETSFCLHPEPGEPRRLRADVLVSSSEIEQRAKEVMSSEPLQVTPQVQNDTVGTIVGRPTCPRCRRRSRSLTRSVTIFVSALFELSELSELSEAANSAGAGVVRPAR